MKSKHKTEEQPVHLINESAKLRQAIEDSAPRKTGRRQEDEALKKSEIRYRRLFETAEDGIVLLDAATGQILDINPFLLKMLGYSHKDFLGKKLWESKETRKMPDITGDSCGLAGPAPAISLRRNPIKNKELLHVSCPCKGMKINSTMVQYA